MEAKKKKCKERTKPAESVVEWNECDGVYFYYKCIIIVLVYYVRILVDIHTHTSARARKYVATASILACGTAISNRIIAGILVWRMFCL